MMAGTFVLTDQIRNAFSDIFGTSFAGNDVYLSQRPAFTWGTVQGEVGTVSAAISAQVRPETGFVMADSTTEGARSLARTTEAV